MSQRDFSSITIVVGVLAGAFLLVVGLAFFENAKVKFRDTQRISDMKEFSEKLEAYRSRYNRFPTHPRGIEISGNDALSRQLLGDLLFTRIPLDPKYPEYSYHYQSDRAGLSYVIFFCLETDTIKGYEKGCGNSFRP